MFGREQDDQETCCDNSKEQLPCVAPSDALCVVDALSYVQDVCSGQGKYYSCVEFNQRFSLDESECTIVRPKENFYKPLPDETPGKCCGFAIGSHECTSVKFQKYLKIEYDCGRINNT